MADLDPTLLLQDESDDMSEEYEMSLSTDGDRLSRELLKADAGIKLRQRDHTPLTGLHDTDYARVAASTK
ncbi:hypothetical protein V1264_014126 [Littorina saxatilis]|uniref:Uncharacterized protein n=1 Tax=Littorina saxatilis TaxID=31220 RepID=A0AAN9AMS7_9CAEN